MATKISEYSSTPASNTDLDGINLSENVMVPSDVNDALRMQMAHLKDLDTGTSALTSPEFTSATISGGTIDNSVIGGTTPAAGSFTNVTASGTVDGRDVSVDGAKLDGIEASADVTDATNVAAAGALMTAGGTMTGDINFGTNDKAIFGSGNDLSVFHDGSHSYVSDAGTGNLQLSTNGTAIKMLRGNGEVLSSFNIGGSVDLYHSNGKKFETTATGVDVTGNIDFSGGILASNGSVQFVMDKDNNGGEVFVWGHNASNATTNELMRLTSAGLLGIGTTSPNFPLSFGANIGKTIALFENGGSSVYGIGMGGAGSAGDPYRTKLFSNGAERIAITDAGSVGIGTAAPSQKLTVEGTANNQNSEIKITAAGVASGYLGSNSNGLNIGTDSYGIVFKTGVTGGGSVGATGTERLRIDNSGKVGIGTSSPPQKFVVSNAGANNIVMSENSSASIQMFMQANSGTGSVGTLTNHDVQFLANNSEKIRLTSFGDVGIGRSDPQNIVGNHGGGLVVRSAAGRAATTTLFAVQSSNSYSMIEHLHNGQLKLRNDSNAQTLLVDNAGNLTTTGSITANGGFVGAGNTPNFGARRSNAQTTNIGVWTKVQFNQEIVDSDGKFDMPADRFTPTVAGTYIIHGQLANNNLYNQASLEVAIYKNGSILAMSEVIANNSTSNRNHTVNVTAIDVADTNDYYELWGRQQLGNGVAITEGSRNIFLGYKI